MSNIRIMTHNLWKKDNNSPHWEEKFQKRACRGKEKVLSECFALCPYDAGYAVLKRTSDWLFVNGINKLVPHAFHYGYSAFQRADAGKSYFFQDSKFDEYKTFSGYAGNDSFSYVARDKYGNYSASAEVSVSVSRSSLSSSFDDMKNSDAHAAAIKLSQEGIMSGTQIGDGYYFQPNAAVSRSEFVVLAMQTLGIKEVNTLRTTGFFDDAEIPVSMKGYVAAARELEYVNGSYNADGKLCFFPNDNITRAEAALIVGRMIEVATPVISPSLGDYEDIPTWARSSVLSLCAIGVMETNDGKIEANEIMTRGETAKMLAAMLSLKD